MSFVFPYAHIPSIAIAHCDQRFPVHRIYCVGRNYADHAKEMNATINKAEPVFFLKPADAIVTEGNSVPYPLATAELHHEVEMVVALHSGGTFISEKDALTHVLGYGVGLDLTRRDLQTKAKANGLPWDTAKGFDASAPVSAIHPVSEINHPRQGLLQLKVNDELRQSTDIKAMIFSVPEIIHALSKLFELKAGDLIFTGTPAGVGPLQRGDRFHASLAGVAELYGDIL